LEGAQLPGKGLEQTHLNSFGGKESEKKKKNFPLKSEGGFHGGGRGKDAPIKKKSKGQKKEETKGCQILKTTGGVGGEPNGEKKFFW